MTQTPALTDSPLSEAMTPPWQWTKLGRVYCAAGETPWAQSRAFLPTPFRLSPDRIRVYAAFLDADQVGRIGYVDVDARDPLRILAVSDTPVLDIGAPGTFDDNGVTPCCVVPADDGTLYMYYTGWQLGVKIRYTLLTGVAASTDGGRTFTRCTQVPLLDRCDGELFVRAASFVQREGPLWRMWYIGGDQWVTHQGKQLPSYNMRALSTHDPLRFPGVGTVCLDTAHDGDEFGFGRPFILRRPDRTYHMWYSIRTFSRGYRLGYATSPDGLTWRRADHLAGIDVSPTGWDAEMICYGAVQSTAKETYLFYNGNNYGETGFGVAVLTTLSADDVAPFGRSSACL